MSGQHTSGPWEVRPPTRENPSRAMVCAHSGFVEIYDAPLTNETKANARLIAAAPDMLEAIAEVMLIIETKMYTDEFERELNRWVVDRGYPIQKATGAQ